MSAVLAWPVLVPLAGAGLCALSPPRAARAIACATAVTAASFGVAVAFAVAHQGPLRHDVGGWGAPVGIALRADGLSALLLVTIGVVGSLTLVAMLRERVARARRAGGLLALFLFTWAGLAALVLSGDVFNLYVGTELVTLSAVVLIGAGRGRAAARAALRYLLVSLAGSLFYLLGVALLYGAYGTLDLGELGGAIRAGRVTDAAIALATAGLCLKSALFPLHGWLPPAYVAAPPAVAAWTSALVSKAPFYVLLRLWVDVVPAETGRAMGALLGALGAVAVVWASAVAFRERRLEPLVAYSSVAQLGYLFLFFPLGSRQALEGVVVLAVSHAAAKASMFLAAGAVERALGHDRLGALRGLAHHMPLTFVTLAIAGTNLMGMPPSGGFVAKWLLVRESIVAERWWIAAVVLVGGLMAAAYVFRILRGAFLPLPRGTHPRAVPRGPELVALALALLSLFLGCAPSSVVALVGVGRSP